MKQVIAIVAEPEQRRVYARILSPLATIRETDARPAGPPVLPGNIAVAVVDCGTRLDSGLRMLQDLRERLPEVPVLMVSAVTSEDAALRALRMGAREFILAPVDERIFCGLVRFLLEERMKAGLSTGAGGIPALPSPVLRALCLIDCEYCNHLSLDDLAAHAFQSKFHFCREFRRHVGMPPLKYLNLVRVREAMKLLSGSQDTVAKVARDVGFGDVSTFSRAFRCVTGTSPAAFRAASANLREQDISAISARTSATSVMATHPRA